MKITILVDGKKPIEGNIELETPPVPGRLPVTQHYLGIIKQDLTVPLTFENEVQACPLQDTQFGTGKGHTYRVSDSWVYYMREVMTQPAWNWWIAMENMLMINRSSKWGSGTEEPMFENIGLPNNFLEFDMITSTHARVVGKSSTDFDTSVLDSSVDRWPYKPTEYWMATTQNRNDRSVGNVGDGSYRVFTPVIRMAPEQWIHLGRLELFPIVPRTVTYLGTPYYITGYSVYASNVYGHAEELDVPLRIVTNGIAEHPCPDWHLHTAPLPV
jgi:hypothetical protein